MSFKTKTDYFGLGSTSGLQITSATENKSKSTAEAKGENGFVVAVEPYGEVASPSNDFVVLNAGCTLSSIVLGSITSIGTGTAAKKYCIASLNVNTSAGAAPTVSVSGMQVESNATANCTATIPSITISGLHHAQNFGAFTLTGLGAHLTQCSLAVGGTVSTATKDGEVVAHDLTDARITVTATIQVSDQTYPVPTVTPESGWTVTSPLSETNPDADFPTYSVSLQKILAADTAQANG